MSHLIPKKDLLIEIGTEELPPKSLQLLSNAFIANLTKECQGASLVFDSMEGFSTPRRIAVRINGLSTLQPEQRLLKKGPAKIAAFDSDGNPTQAALGFALACQTTVDALQIQESNKGSFLIFEQIVPGLPTESLIPKIVSESLTTLPLPKRMRWGSREDNFIRPIHWIVLLFGNMPISTELFGITSGNLTSGHRFHHPDMFILTSPTEYESSLKKIGKVIAQFDERKNIIFTELKKHAFELKAEAFITPDLLDQVTGLVEWPVILVGTFDSDFLKLPQEALISAMQVHQKCFPMLDNTGKLLPKFLIVSNIESSHPATVIQGNERVMQARLADAKFYYDIDQKDALHTRSEDLKKVVFQHGLGTLWDKSNRIGQLAKVITESLPSSIQVSTSDCDQAAHLCKADLLTQMVGEFPELQGIMGRYYALSSGESTAIANAIEEHYHPRFAQDTLPASTLGAIIALSDKIDTLVGLFGIGKRPTGEKDPFALRRQTLGILRILIEKKLNLDLQLIFNKSQEIYNSLLPQDPSLTQVLLEFSFDRLRAWYQEQGIATRVFDAVLAKWPTNPLDFDQRILAVTHFKTLSEAESLSAANKRVGNLLIKSEVTISADASFDLHLCQELEEKELGQALIQQESLVAPLLKKSQYTEALKSLSTLKEPIDHFFDKVMVMVDDNIIRNNRLTLLNRLRLLFLNIADISIL